MAGAAGCFGSLVIVGSLIAAFGSNWLAHPVAGRVAIGEFSAAYFAGTSAGCDEPAIAFVYIYDVNFSYSWAPIGWGKSPHLPTVQEDVLNCC